MKEAEYNKTRKEVLELMMKDDLPWSVSFKQEAKYGHSFGFGIDTKLKNILVGAMLAYYGTKEKR